MCTCRIGGKTLLVLSFFSLFQSLRSQSNHEVTMQGTSFRQQLFAPPGTSNVRLCSIEKDHRYTVIAVGAVDGQQAAFTLSMKTADDEKLAQTITFPGRPNQRSFVANGNCSELILDANVAAAGPEGIPMFLSVTCDDCPQDLSWLEKFQENAERAMNLTTTGSIAGSSLISGTLISGDCFEVTNIVSTGNAASRGTFDNGTASIDIQNGLVLCTGNVNVLSGPNNSANINGGFALNTPDDADLNTILTGNQFDLSKIEFDFVPTSDMIQFDYVFGSEEYCEYVGSQYNDVFGFFISGPGINGSQNLALIPGTSDPITINDVNHLSNSNYYVNNNNFNPCQGQPVKALAFNQLDGWTVRLTAMAQVIPCETYHIKLAIADVADAIYTSAVFLKANSFNAGDKITAEPVYPSGQDFLYEDCDEGFIRFVRTGDLSQPNAMTYTVTDSSTAIVGMDYDALPDTIYFAIGQSEVLIPIQVLADSLSDDAEVIIIQLENTCECEDIFVEINLRDKPLLEIALDSMVLCADEVGIVNPTVTGGLGTYTFLWNTGETTTSIGILVAGTSICTVTVTDGCGTTSTAETTVTLNALPTAAMGGTDVLCANALDTAFLEIQLTGDAPWQVTLENNGTGESLTVLSSPAIVPATSAGIYNLLGVVSGFGCVGVAAGFFSIDAVEVDLSLTQVEPACFGSFDGELSVEVGGGIEPYFYVWNQGGTGPGQAGLGTGTYSVTATDNHGCTAETSAVLSEPQLLTAAIAEWQNIDCNQPEGWANLITGGGMPAYTYVWSNNSTQEDAVFSSGGTYTVTVTDANNCTTTSSVILTANITLPEANILTPEEITCTDQMITLDGGGSSNGSQFLFLWTTTDGSISNGANTLAPSINAPGTYQLLVTDTINGCIQTASVVVSQNTILPQVDAGPDGLLTCVATSLNLSGWGSGGNLGILYAWSGPGIVGSGDVPNPIVNAAGPYLLTVTDVYNGCSAVSSMQVGQNTDVPLAEAGNGFELTCTVEQGNLSAAGSSVGPGFAYTWSTGNGNLLSGGNTTTPLVDAAGVYLLSVLNTLNGCFSVDSVGVVLNADLPEGLTWLAEMPGCDNRPGSVVVETVTGGVGPYLYSLDEGETFVSSGQFVGLAPGSYNLVVQDVNGCEFFQELQLLEPINPEISLIPSIELSFGDSALLEATINIPMSEVDTIIWSPTQGLTFTQDPLVVWAEPFNFMQYTVTVVNMEGCTDRAVVTVRVDNPNIWAPNVISSGNQDGLNDHFLLFSTPGSVQEIVALGVYDRWGSMLYFNEHFQPNEENLGWNGSFRGQFMNPGVYVWWAEVELINGEKIILKGDVTIVN